MLDTEIFLPLAEIAGVFVVDLSQTPGRGR